jgi:plastocyanin
MNRPTRVRLQATLLLAFALISGEALAGTVQGQLHRVGSASLPAGEYIVSVEDIDEAPVQATAVVDQRNLRFVPHLLVIRRGTTVKFPNSDPLKHNVFSISPSKRFNLGMYSQGESRSVVFDQAGIVEVLCNVHLEMSAFILVQPNHYFAQAGADGRFRIAGVPAGHHRLRCWREALPPQFLDVDVPADGTVQADFWLTGQQPGATRG